MYDRKIQKEKRIDDDDDDVDDDDDDDDDSNNTETQTLSSLTDFSLHICSSTFAVSVHNL